MYLKKISCFCQNIKTTNGYIMKKFNEFDISKKLQNVLPSMGYVSATKVQEEAIQHIIAGRDVLASSQTGTGKTGASLIPLITKIEREEEKHILIVAPTRELAKQVYTVANKMIKEHKNIVSALIIGGEDMSRQIRRLKQKPRIIIGTPGRINDHLSRKTFHLKKTHFLVLDETDRMLDMGFGVQINEIIKYIPEERQTILFSATLPKSIVKLSKKYLKDPARISIGDSNSIADKITQNLIHTEDKFKTLTMELEKTYGSVLIFTRTRRGAEKIKKKLKGHPLRTDALHGGLRQNKRERVMRAFRNKKCSILVATDVASRGLDVPHIEFVINYDIPDCPTDYIHRIGRTARAEKTGIALSLISKSDKYKWNAIQKFLSGEEDEGSLNYRKNSSRRRKFSGNKKGNRKFDKKRFKDKRQEGEKRSGKESSKESRDDGSDYRKNSRKRRFFGRDNKKSNTRSRGKKRKFGC